MSASTTTSTTTNPNQLLDKPPAKRSTKKLVIGCTLAALLLFVALDVVNRLLIPSDKYASAGRSWIWWAVKNYRARTQTPDIVLLGSSLMIAAQNDGDATFLNRALDAAEHARSEYFEYKLQGLLGKKVTTGSFALGGEMASDGYAIISTMLKNKNAPKVIVWGVAPRDFIDKTYLHPEDTAVVRYLSQISGQPDLLKTNNKRFWLQVEDSLAAVSTIYARRPEYIRLCRSSMINLLTPFFPSLATQTAPGPNWFLPYVVLFSVDDNLPGEWIVQPYGTKVVVNKDNSSEYKQRYVPFNAGVCDTQFKCFARALALAHKQGTRVVIVNMPLQAANMNLIPRGVYALYLAKLQSATNDNQADFIDLNRDRLFTASDFYDPVHLNGIGGIKLFNYLSEAFLRHHYL